MCDFCDLVRFGVHVCALWVSVVLCRFEVLDGGSSPHHTQFQCFTLLLPNLGFCCIVVVGSVVLVLLTVFVAANGW